MTQSASPPPAPGQRQAMAALLRDLNAHVSAWVASMSWWRLIVLFLLILLASAMVSDLLRLKHDYVKVPAQRRDDVTVTIGKEGIRVQQKGKETVVKPPMPPLPPGASAEEIARAAEQAAEKATEKAVEKAALEAVKALGIEDDEHDDDRPRRTISQRVWTFRGLLGDIGAAVMIILFAYLAAAKIVLRKVAQADEKVKTAVDAAEREAMDRQLAQAKLQVLQAQVEPHFLFNTLATVDYLIETDPARASQMQKKLITYLRGALPQMRQESSTVGRELGLIRSYLDLIKMRIEDRLDIEIDVPQFLETAEFPPMMLQSLVENAIKHGIEPKPEGGKVTVAAKIQRGMLWLEVRDSGVGILDTERLEAPTSGGGIGLQNIRERLAMLYPGKGRLTLMSDDNSGTVVRIGIPYRDGPEPEEVAAPKAQTA